MSKRCPVSFEFFMMDTMSKPRTCSAHDGAPVSSRNQRKKSKRDQRSTVESEEAGRVDE
jgi:hypothetical protein